MSKKTQIIVNGVVLIVKYLILPFSHCKKCHFICVDCGGECEEVHNSPNISPTPSENINEYEEIEDSTDIVMI